MLEKWLDLAPHDKISKVEYKLGLAGAGVIRQAPVFQMHDFITVSRVTMLASEWKTGETVAEALQQIK